MNALTIITLVGTAAIAFIAMEPMVDLVTAAEISANGVPAGIPRLFSIIEKAWWLLPTSIIIVAVGVGIKSLLD